MKQTLLLGVFLFLLCACSDKQTDEDKGTDEDSTDPPEEICPFEASAKPDGDNWTVQDTIEFNDNGGWCWYQDERVIIDDDAGIMLIGSVPSGERKDQAEVTHWNLSTNTGDRHVLGPVPYTDDHDAPALIQTPNDGYAAMWAGHNTECASYYSVYSDGEWTDAKEFDWFDYGCPGENNDEKVTYSNMWYMGETLYSFARSIGMSPNMLYSEDDGKTFEKGGRLTSTPRVEYNAGYYKYWGNNVDRIDFLATEGHPRDVDTSLYHGYLLKEGDSVKIYNSFGDVIDEDAMDDEAASITDYTPVFETGDKAGDMAINRLWNADLVRYEDGTIAAIGTGRKKGSIGAGDPEKQLLYFRFDGKKWTTTYLAQAGTKLYENEQDYTGLGALDPDNPHIIYISTPFDPSTNEGDFYGKKEIWKGVTCDDGKTFTWEPVTANSDVDNLRPIVPKWNSENSVLLWLRGDYITAQEYNLKIVGFFEKADEKE